MCETPFWRIEPQSLSPTPHKHLYLWSNHRTKGVQWYIGFKVLSYLQWDIILYWVGSARILNVWHNNFLDLWKIISSLQIKIFLFQNFFFFKKKNLIWERHMKSQSPLQRSQNYGLHQFDIIWYAIDLRSTHGVFKRMKL